MHPCETSIFFSFLFYLKRSIFDEMTSAGHDQVSPVTPAPAPAIGKLIISIMQTSRFFNLFKTNEIIHG